MPTFSKPFALFLISIYVVFCTLTLEANHKSNALDLGNNKIENALKDTVRINQLFELGYQFIDGPSDSLLFYFGKALVIIQNNLDEINTTQPSNLELAKVYQNLNIRCLIEFGIEYFYQNKYTQALKYFNDALKIARLTNNLELISECINEIGIVYKNQGDYDRALSYYNQALEMAKQTTDSGWVASCQINIGNVYKEKGFLNIAQKYYLEALKIIETLGQNRRIAACYQNIGDIYNKQRDYDNARDYFSKALELAKITNDKVREISIYLNSADIYIKTGEYNTARDFLEKAILLYKETGYEHERDYCYTLLGNSWLEEKDFNQAIIYYEKALQISLLKKDKISTAEIEEKLGSAYFQLKDHKKALQLFESSLRAAESMGLLELAINAKLNLSKVYEILGQFQLSFQNYKDYSQLKDSLFNAEKYRAIKELEVKYESEKKEQQLELLTDKNELQELKLSRQNRLLFASLAIIGLLILIGYLLRKQNLLKSRHKAIDLEQRLLRVQMNPHFIFNSLIAIQSYIYKKEPVVAGDYLARFAKLVRLILENSRVEFVSIKNEIETLKAYLELQGLRFENKFSHSIEIGDKIETENTLVPPMFTQPFIENAIEHGLRHKTTKGHLEIIYAIKNKSCIEIIISDDGVGRETAVEIEKKKQHQSMALNISKERLKVLSKKYKYAFTLELIDLKDDKNSNSGTKVCITIPYKII